ncbi:MAG TPA: UTP--glucose-1-phosphate uridylyltransferase [Solirubrobacteraceae bacterium]|nr:UTP--glucose-1-phosphate uridylyltransferase [Solirubrobacteraceae bacterium]
MTSTADTRAAVAKLQADGASAQAVAAFEAKLAMLADPSAGMLPGDELEPLGDVPALADVEADPGALDAVAVIKLNGGLGTSMGLQAPKSTVVAKDGRTFLDVIATQVLALRERHGVRLPLVLMNSRTTRPPSLELLGEHRGLERDDVPQDFLQGREPKLLADSLQPAEWPADPALEWYPPGHGELYVALAGTGTLAKLLDAGYRYAFVSNADNLGAVADPRVATWLQAEEVPFAMEVVRGTAADRKGGHLATREGRLVLRETAQTPPGDASFTDVERWRWYNTNNLWVDLRTLDALLRERPAGPELPLIVNRKTVDPTDSSSPQVLQLESAMGAAVGAIDGARPIHVPRSRFVPVKTTNDLLVLRSDAYTLEDDGRVTPAFDGEAPPTVTLDDTHFKHLRGFEERFAHGAPSLRAARALTVEGDVRFGADVTVEGDVTVTGPADLADGTVLR